MSPLCGNEALILQFITNIQIHHNNGDMWFSLDGTGMKICNMKSKYRCSNWRAVFKYKTGHDVHTMYWLLSRRTSPVTVRITTAYKEIFPKYTEWQLRNNSSHKYRDREHVRNHNIRITDCWNKMNKIRRFIIPTTMGSFHWANVEFLQQSREKEWK